MDFKETYIEKQTQLLEGIMAGDLKKVEAALAAGAELNSFMEWRNSGKNYSNAPPIFVACMSKQFKIADYLIDKGADIFLLPKKIGTAAGYLVIEKLTEKDMIDYVTIKMADLNEPDENGDTPFARVVESDNFNSVKYLVEKMNANVCKKGRNKGDSPLIKATKNHNLHMVKYLVEQGAGRSMGTALHCALDNGFIDISQFFIGHQVEPDHHSAKGQTPLIKAVEGRYEDIIDLLITQGANLNLTNSDGKTALSRSIDLNFHSITSKLIKRGANVNISDEDGKTPLMKIVIKGDSVLCKRAVEAGAKVDRTDKNGLNVLNFAASNGDLLTTIYLIKHSPDCVIRSAKSDIENFAACDTDFAQFWKSYKEHSFGNPGNFLAPKGKEFSGQE